MKSDWEEGYWRSVPEHRSHPWARGTATHCPAAFSRQTAHLVVAPEFRSPRHTFPAPGRTQEIRL